MSDPLHPMPLPQARERAIERLSTHFANDDISLEDLEQRMERAYQATTVAELDALVSDLGGGPVRAPQVPERKAARSKAVALPVERERIMAIMGETKRMGVWTAPQELDILALMSDTTIDLTHAELPSGIVDIELHVMWAAVKIIVPPGVRVANQLSVIMSSASNQLIDSAPAPDAPVIRLKGLALMSEVKVLVRRREDGLLLSAEEE